MFGSSKSMWTAFVFLIALLVQQVYPLPSATTCSLQEYKGSAQDLLANRTLAVEDDDGGDDEDDDKAPGEPLNSTIETRTETQPGPFPPRPGRVALGREIWSQFQLVMRDPRPDRPPPCNPRLQEWKVMVNPPTGEDPSLPAGETLDLEMWSKIDAHQVSAGAPTTDWNRDSRWTTISGYSEVNMENELGLFEYRNAYSPWTGSIICLTQRNRIFKNDKPYSAPTHWGVPSFVSWNTYATAENIPVSSLRRIAMQKISQRVLKHILFWALREKSKFPIDPTRPSDGDILSAYVTLDSDPDVFFALLTTPFVKSVVNMLKEHRFELGRKTISGFSVSWVKTETESWNNNFNFVIDLQPYDQSGVRPA